MEIIKYLGEIIAKEIRISPPAGRGLLKLAIKDHLGPFKPLEEINYQDLKSIVKNSFRKRLEELNIKNISEIINLIQNELILNQSLITITKI